MTPNVKAFLATIGFAEGTVASPATRNDGYDVIVTGRDGVHEVFTDYTTHPFANGRASKVINSKGLTSNASGRYQIMLKDFSHYCAMLSLDDKTLYPDGAFSPAAQDAYALQLIRERSAIPLIEGGRIEMAIQRCSNLWASFPGAGYANQPERPMAKMLQAYVNAGGTIA